MARPRLIQNIFNPPKSNVQFSEGHKSKGILDDHAVRQNLASKEGTIEHVPTAENHIVNKKYVDSIATRQAVELFLTTNASDIGTYDDLDIDVSPDAETTIQQTITAGSTTLINAFASQLNEAEIDALEILESGIYELHTHAEADFPNGMTIYFEFYHRTAGGTETLLGTSHDSGILGLTETEINLHANVTNDKNFIAGDRIVVKVYGRNTGGANKDITIHMEGDTVSRTEFPGFISPIFVPAHAAAHETGGGDLLAVESIPTALTAGSVIFSDGTNLAQDNFNLFWDDANKRLSPTFICPSVPAPPVFTSNLGDVPATKVITLEADS